MVDARAAASEVIIVASNAKLLPAEDFLIKSDVSVSSGDSFDTENTSVENAKDPWAVTDLVVKSTPWKDLTCGGKTRRVLWNYIFRQVVLCCLMYCFFLSLDFLGMAFRLLAGKAAGQVFRDSMILRNPVAGLMIGIVTTVFLQSSSTTTSIIVSMVGSNLLTVKIAVPIIMGANIGTSITNTLVSIGQSGDRDQFRRAFGGATVHDMFNLLSVLILLPLEIASGYLELLSGAIINSLPLATYKDGDVQLLKAITEPVTQYVLKIDSKAIIAIAKNETVGNTLIKVMCNEKVGNLTIKSRCTSMFMNVAGIWEDWIIGLILLILSLILLCTCLVLMVKVLSSIFKGPIAVILKKFVNADMPGKCGRFITGYFAILIGAVLTILVQSSSIFTSTLTPLVGLGVITVERMYPLTLGSNIGTTVTAILSSLAQDSSSLKESLQISICHLFFNISGLLLWYPLPFMRKVPINMAKSLGDITAKYRWFAVIYIILAFFIIPAVLFGLSFIGDAAVISVVVIAITFALVITIINVLQKKMPNRLPERLRNWNFLPVWCRSLKPYDSIIVTVIHSCECCKKLRQSKNETSAEEDEETKQPLNDTKMYASSGV